MILASKGGTVESVTLVYQTRRSWTLKAADPERTFTLNKKSQDQRAFNDINSALEWIGTPQAREHMTNL
ncbi:hypothetical protein LCGC14_0282410 [marine sediment metagenome]|uniref:Uncharacterized protein n=1 Tax=marine sediment metagenome TaxID=412755 RepID=A0A0F9UCF6_9ZZZZ